MNSTSAKYILQVCDETAGAVAAMGPLDRDKGCSGARVVAVLIYVIVWTR